jgi:hypothetical protein
MSDTEFLAAVAVATALNTLSVIVGILINVAQINSLRKQLDMRFDRSSTRG